jgi:hypothetical protein
MLEMRSAAWDFNREIVWGECGALAVANLTAVVTSHYTHSAIIISSSAIPGTLIGGSLFWLAARIYDQVTGGRFKANRLVSDVSYFTPAAIVLGLLIYDPAIFLISHHLLKEGSRVELSVIVGQIGAFLLFLLGMNGYRSLLLKITGKCL